ncbi:class I SAM-dependent methyltransferase [Endozoicomonas sp. G2_1]|uniref:class I SAM-dependent methyltransferase n=1 Tax=Endozoicomonas sp. G2_1 TaxID=2821091 RepID=UPI001ADB0B71|nr:class I SAM-dependent methyltransferase [Endozoicomonas sp. G2_1]MBO9492011.1 class I SAM-dependent methyltransferase [Endozoicomonas sp. G2_1]
MEAIYDQIGTGYTVTRCTDPKIEAQIKSELVNAKNIVNIGAGTGSYEPEGVNLVAVEPSIEMINQRSPCSYPVKQAKADKLPFPDNYFSHAMTVLSMHHWENRQQAFDEIKRVTTTRFIAITWLPDSAPFWLTRDYFPEIYEIDRQIFPSIHELKKSFKNIEVKPLLIPDDCEDGFLACFWKRPEAYLHKNVRSAISTFSKITKLELGLEKLKNDLTTGVWNKRNAGLLNKSYIDVGYRIVSVDLSMSV